jgi:hypothetical protein
MPDRLDEIKKRAMVALSRHGRDAIDAHDGHVCGIQAQVGDVTVCTTEDTRLLVRVYSKNKMAYKEHDNGKVLVDPPMLDLALENLRIHQVLDDLADA